MNWKKIKNFIMLGLLFACVIVLPAYARVYLEDFEKSTMFRPGYDYVGGGYINGTYLCPHSASTIHVQDGALYYDFSAEEKDGNWKNSIAFQKYISIDQNSYVDFTFTRDSIDNTGVYLCLDNWDSTGGDRSITPFHLKGDTITLGYSDNGGGETITYTGLTGHVAAYAENLPTGGCRVTVWLNGEQVYSYVNPYYTITAKQNQIQTQFVAMAKMDVGDTLPTITIDNVKILQDEGMPTEAVYAGDPELQFDYENGGMFFMSENTFPFHRVKSVRQIANFSHQVQTVENVLAQYGDADRYKIQKETLQPGEVLVAELLDNAADLDGVKDVKSFVWDKMTNLTPLVQGFGVEESIAKADRPEVLAQKLIRVGDTHPRILTTAAELAKVEQYKEDETFADMYTSLVDWRNTQNSGSYMTAGIPNHGSGTGSICDMIYDRATVWGYLYQTTGDEQYAADLMRDMVKVAEYDNWYDEVNYGGNGRFLYTAHIAAALAIGYDMTYDYLSKEENIVNRDKIVKAIYDKAVLPYLEFHRKDNRIGWSRRSDNWNMICNGGVGLACLAIGDLPEYQENCTIALNYALRGIRYVAEYFPSDGAWTEGFNYYPYMMRHGTDFFVSLINTLGDDYGYRDFAGMNASAADAIKLGGSKYMYAYSDAPMTPGKGTPFMLYFAKYLDMPELGYYRREQFKEKFAQVEAGTAQKKDLQSVLNFRDLLWYDSDYSNVPQNAGKAGYDDAFGMPLDSWYQGTGIVALHTDYGNSQGFVAANYGKNNDWHNHTDMGGFVYESQGEQWFIELGYVTYGWPDQFNDLLYRNKPEGHNCMIFNPTGANDPDQIVSATGSLVAAPVFGENASYFTMDLTNAYADRLNSYKRLIYLDKNTQGFAVKDKFSLKGESNEYYWFAHTKAEITIDEDDPTTAILTQNGKNLKVHVTGGEFTKMDAVRLFQFDELSSLSDPENPGITKLVVHATGKSGNCEITVTAVPLDDNDQGTLPDVSDIAF